MLQTVEDTLIEMDQTWNDFCVNPYPTLSKIKSKRIVKSTTKDGYFVFDHNTIYSILFENDAKSEKRLSSNVNSNVIYKDFFQKWLFYRNGSNHAVLKKELFSAIQKNNNPFVFDITKTEPENLFTDLRKAYFSYLVRLFFYVPEEQIDLYFDSAEKIMAFIQGHRFGQVDEIEIEISNIKSIYKSQRTFDFSKDFFESAVLNTIVDGFEPLSDITWNTVEQLFVNNHTAAKAAYRNALSDTPSFRYVVRHLVEPFNDLEAGSKLYCFLSSNVLFYDENHTRQNSFAFGAGPHQCPGRGLVDRIIPEIASVLHEFLRTSGVKNATPKRRNGLGAEGVYGIQIHR